MRTSPDGDAAVDSNRRWPVAAVVAGLHPKAIPPLSDSELEGAVGVPDAVGHELDRQRVNTE